jgi:hypothetical protein
MQTNLVERSKFNPDDSQRENSASDINQLVCCLKNAIFSKYISDYLIEKAEEVNNRNHFFVFDFSQSKMWDLYEQRIDQYLQEKHLDITCQHSRPQVRYSKIFNLIIK